MKFRTKLSTTPPPWRVQYSENVVFLGSCFASSVGERFAKAKISTLINPWGTLYHSSNILANLSNATTRTTLSEQNIVQIGRRYTHFDVHSDISALGHSELSDLYTSVNDNLIQHISSSKLLFITLGTAWHYRLKNSDRIVANCHKRPSNEFERKLSSSHEIYTDLQQIIKTALNVNKELTLIFTVSPVRHIRDGLIANNRSKSHLLSAIHQICDEQDQAYYFPSYELLLDDLRDYRYYDEDLVHPSSVAIAYIWQYLINHHMTEPAKKTLDKVNNIQRKLNHRSFDPQSKEHRDFLTALLADMVLMKEQEALDFDEDIQNVKQQLSDLNT